KEPKHKKSYSFTFGTMPKPISYISTEIPFSLRRASINSATSSVLPLYDRYAINIFMNDTTHTLLHHLLLNVHNKMFLNHFSTLGHVNLIILMRELYLGRTY